MGMKATDRLSPGRVWRLCGGVSACLKGIYGVFGVIWHVWCCSIGTQFSMRCTTGGRSLRAQGLSKRERACCIDAFICQPVIDGRPSNLQ